MRLLFPILAASALAPGRAVIAAPQIIDQPDAVPSGMGLAVGVIMLLLAPVTLVILIRRRAWRLSPEHEDARPPRDRQLTFSLLAGGAIAMLVAGYLGAGTAARMTGATMPSATLPDQVRLASGLYLFQGVVVVALAVALGWRPRSRADWTRAAGRGVLALLLVWPLVNALSWAMALVTTWLRETPLDPLAHETLRRLAQDPFDAWAIAMSALVVLAAPIAEEVMYRACVQGALRVYGVGPWPSIVAASLVFAVMHVSAAAPHALPGLFVLSLGFGWAYERTRSLVAPVVMHMVFNLGNLLVMMVAGTGG